MATGALERTLVVAAVAFRSAFAGNRGISLALAAAVFPALVAVIDLAAFPGLDLLATSEVLFSELYLPVVLLLVCLVLGVGAFRGELEEDTLVYPLNRTIPRAALAAGKYLGLVGAAAVVLVPSSVVGFGLAVGLGTGPTMGSAGLDETIVLLPLLGIIAYGAVFFLLGVLTRQALVIGLLYGFLWETFVSLLAGPIREVSVIYYLRGVGAGLVSGGGLGAGAPAMALPGVIAGAILTAVASLLAASLVLAYVELRPAAAPT